MKKIMVVVLVLVVSMGIFAQSNEQNTEYFDLLQRLQQEYQNSPEKVLGGLRSLVGAENLIIRKVQVNRSRSRQEALDATNRKQYTDRKVVDAMPKGEGNEVEVVFFKPDLSRRNGYISDDDLEKEFEIRGLKPADPISVAAVNEADPAFADEKPHGTHWKNDQDEWCFAAFDRDGGERYVLIYRNDCGWNDFWWFAGVRK